MAWIEIKKNQRAATLPWGLVVAAYFVDNEMVVGSLNVGKLKKCTLLGSIYLLPKKTDVAELDTENEIVVTHYQELTTYINEDLYKQRIYKSIKQ